MIKRITSAKVQTWLWATIAIAVVERIFLYVLYRPVSYNDTASYRHLADTILAGWGAYDGTRTPGYPIFLALVRTDQAAYAVQLFLGLVTTILLFYIAWRVSGHGWLAGLVALAHTLNPQQIFFEADLLTESLTTFFLILSIAILVVIYFSKEPSLVKVLGLACLTGIMAGWATLTRPLFIFVPFWMAFCLVVFWHARSRIRWAGALMVGVSGTVVIGLWVIFIYTRFHMFSVTTMTGFHLVQNTGLFFEFVPDKYASIRDVFLQYRAAQIAATGSAGNTIWAAIPALQNASGLGFYNLSNLLTSISLQLIIHHPVLYLKNVILGWLWFWKVPVYYAADSFRYTWLGIISKWVIPVWRVVLIMTNVGFVGGSVLLIWRRVRQMLRMDKFLWLLIGFVWITSILQTLLDHGDNPRFMVPVQSLVAFIVIYWGYQLILSLRHKDETLIA